MLKIVRQESLQIASKSSERKQKPQIRNYNTGKIILCKDFVEEAKLCKIQN